MLKDALAEVKEELEGEVDQIDLPLDDVSTTITNNLNSCIIMLHINLRANHFVVLRLHAFSCILHAFGSQWRIWLQFAVSYMFLSISEHIICYNTFNQSAMLSAINKFYF